MFGFLKNLMRKPADAPAQQPDPAPADQGYEYDAAAPEAEVAPEPPPRARAGAGRQNGRAGAPAPQRGGAHGAHGAQGQSAAQAQGRSVQVPLQPILDGLPLEIQPRVVERNAGDLSISIPLEKVLSQLSRGAVKITFGELRQLAPDIFSPDADRDRVAVPLPLNEILSRLNPALIARRRVQKHVEVPAEISSPFDPNNHGMIINVGPSKPDKSSAGGRHVTPGGASQKSSAPSGLPSRGAITSAPTPQPPSMTPATNGPAPIAFAPRPTGDLRSNGPAQTPTPAPRTAAPAPRPPTPQPGHTPISPAGQRPPGQARPQPTQP